MTVRPREARLQGLTYRGASFLKRSQLRPFPLNDRDLKQRSASQAMLTTAQVDVIAIVEPDLRLDISLGAMKWSMVRGTHHNR